MLKMIEEKVLSFLMSRWMRDRMKRFGFITINVYDDLSVSITKEDRVIVYASSNVTIVTQKEQNNEEVR